MAAKHAEPAQRATAYRCRQSASFPRQRSSSSRTLEARLHVVKKVGRVHFFPPAQIFLVLDSGDVLAVLTDKSTISQASSSVIGAHEEAFSVTSRLRALRESLTSSYGPLVGGAALTRALGYPSQSAFRQALAHQRLPVAVFEIQGRRGRFALTADIADWLWSISEGRQFRRPDLVVSQTNSVNKQPGGEAAD